MNRERVYLGLGTNSGNKQDNLQRAIEALSLALGLPVACSSFMESEPWGFESKNSFLNCVVAFDTHLSPTELLNTPEEIETELDSTPTQYSPFRNADGFVSLRTHISYGFPINPIKCNLNLSAGFSWTREPSMIDNMLNITSNFGYDASLSLGSNISENIDFTVEWRGSFNDAHQSPTSKLSRNQYFSHVASGTLKWVFWKGFTLTAAVNYNQYVGFTTNYNEDYLLCNVYLGKKLFKNQQAEILIGVNDILNQNTAFARTVGSGYTQNSWNSTIGRYFTVQFNYNLRHFGKKGSKKIEDYDGMGGRPGGMPFGGGRPPMMHH